MSTEQEVRRALELGTNTISPETAERFRQQMAARGLDPSATLTKHGVGQQTPPDPSNTPKEPQRMATDIDATGLPRLTGEQTEQAAATLRRFWTGDPAELEAALKNAGASPVDQPAPDNRTEEEREFDASNLAAVQPSEYQLDGLWVGRNATDRQGYLAADVPTLERTIRGTMAELQVPQALGRQFADDMLASRDKWSALSEAGDPVSAERHYMEQSTLFTKVAKVGWQEAAAQMKPWLAKMSAATREFLARSGALESAPARIRLWQSFQLSQVRAKMVGKL